MVYGKPYFIACIAFLSTWCIVPSFCEIRGEIEQCLEGPYHKDKPSPETDEYKFCKPWTNLTCCTTQLDNEVVDNDAPKKYRDSWHLCGNLSSECLKFWKRQECFYQCSPYAYQWKDSKIKDALNGVPICASECEAWYEACKNDLICVENVLEHYNRSEKYVTQCPAGSKCMKYTARYGSGENLCNKMWGNSYKYVKKDGNNCMKFWFTPGTGNPNANVIKDVVGGSMPASFPSGLLFLPALYAMAFLW